MDREDRAYSSPATVPAIDRSDRVRLAVRGPDRATFLHNLTTQDVKRLSVGAGREAFVTNPQGKTLGYVTLLACDDHILLRTDREGWDPVLPHLTKYGIFDDVQLDDVSDSTFELHLITAELHEIPAAGDELLSHVATTIDGVPVRLVRENVTGRPGLTLIGPREALPKIVGWVESTGFGGKLSPLAAGEVERLRIAAGIPIAGRDVTPENLPQEVGRDAQAISFVKGCYLGQETVARIDALGHVNRHLCGLRIAPASQTITPGARIEAAGKAVGHVTSVAESTAAGEFLALGYLRTSHSAPGSSVSIVTSAPDGSESRAEAVVVALPMEPN